MPNNGFFDIQKLLSMGSEEKTTEDVRRVNTLEDLDRGGSLVTGFDPRRGRTTTRTEPGARFGPSGHILRGPTEHILGECVVCREDFDRAGEPEKLTVVPRDPGGGGICAGCQRVFCSDHASPSDDGLWWCEECEFDRNIENVEGAVLGWLAGMFSGDPDD